jgi:hypothetical protein
MVYPGPVTKRTPIYNAFIESQNSRQNRAHVLELIRLAMKTARYSRQPERHEPTRALPNQALAFCRGERWADNYFHVVPEAVKSVAGKMKTRTGSSNE